MKKRMLGIAAMAFALTLSSGITAFAGTWKEDEYGKYYENDDGTRPVYAGWFTDPADGAMYYMDPDGYVMTATTVEGYKLGDDGKRIEKTAEDIAREEARKQELATRPSPAKKAAAADVAASAAKNSNVAVSTNRSSYQAEMKVFMDRYFIAAGQSISNSDIAGSTEENTSETTYYYNTSDSYRFLTATLWLNSKETSADYKPQAFEAAYNYNSMGGNEAQVFGDTFSQLTIAALGETEGQAALDAVNGARADGTASFTRDGRTDSGNSYSLTYNNGYVSYSVTCAELDDAATDSAAADSAAQAADSAADTAAEEAAPTSTVIVAGQSSSQE